MLQETGYCLFGILLHDDGSSALRFPYGETVLLHIEFVILNSYSTLNCGSSNYCITCQLSALFDCSVLVLFLFPQWKGLSDILSTITRSRKLPGSLNIQTSPTLENYFLYIH